MDDVPSDWEVVVSSSGVCERLSDGCRLQGQPRIFRGHCCCCPVTCCCCCCCCCCCWLCCCCCCCCNIVVCCCCCCCVLLVVVAVVLLVVLVAVVLVGVVVLAVVAAAVAFALANALYLLLFFRCWYVLPIVLQMLICASYCSSDVDMCFLLFFRCWYVLPIVLQMLICASYCSSDVDMCFLLFFRCWYVLPIVLQMLICASYCSSDVDMCFLLFFRCWYVLPIVLQMLICASYCSSDVDMCFLLFFRCWYVLSYCSSDVDMCFLLFFRCWYVLPIVLQMLICASYCSSDVDMCFWYGPSRVAPHFQRIVSFWRHPRKRSHVTAPKCKYVERWFGSFLCCTFSTFSNRVKVTCLPASEYASMVRSGKSHVFFFFFFCFFFFFFFDRFSGFCVSRFRSYSDGRQSSKLKVVVVFLLSPLCDNISGHSQWNWFGWGRDPFHSSLSLHFRDFHTWSISSAITRMAVVQQGCAARWLNRTMTLDMTILRISFQQYSPLPMSRYEIGSRPVFWAWSSKTQASCELSRDFYREVFLWDGRGLRFAHILRVGQATLIGVLVTSQWSPNVYFAPSWFALSSATIKYGSFSVSVMSKSGSSAVFSVRMERALTEAESFTVNRLCEIDLSKGDFLLEPPWHLYLAIPTYCVWIWAERKREG